jgi:phosphatidylglycerol---prolipoprotein diacylglyceryl transferase
MNYFIYNPRKYLFTGWFNIEFESFFILIAFLFFVFWIIREFRKEKIALNPKELFWFFFSGIFGSLAGGRLWYYIQNWKGFGTLIDLFNLNEPGLTSFGMIIGGIVGIILFSVFQKKEKDCMRVFSRYIDIAAIAAALFVFIYRMGCFHYGDVPGTATKIWWGMFAVDYGKYSGTIMHPTALYLSFSALLIFLFLNWYKVRKKFDGEIGLLFLIIYSFNRFWIEFFRAGTEKYFGLSDGQWILLIVFFLSFSFMFIIYLALAKFGLKTYDDLYNFEKKSKLNVLQTYILKRRK